ncbi:MAG: hypothetical protein QXU18_16030, partial [Thermoplasmatales archaeon]
LWIIAIANARTIYLDKTELTLYRIHKRSAIHSDRGNDRYNCIEDDTVPLLANYDIHDRDRKPVLDSLRLTHEVNLALFCDRDFTLRHYAMAFLMILLSDKRYKIMLVLFKKIRFMNKPIIIKMLKIERNIVNILGKFMAIFK